ncbi:MAG: acyltransferase [Clostridia bacterium]|nr:acyltransferase [Clostridia bacterium]
MNYEKYAAEQEQQRRIQYKFGSKEYSFPDTFRERIRAYTELFNIGEGLSIGHDVFFYRTHKLEGELHIGCRVIFADDITVDYSGKVIIEDDVTISEGTKIYSHKHDLYKLSHRENDNAIPVMTTIKKGAWIGASSIILPGVTIGEYAVVGAGSVVTHDIAPNTIVAGNPARYIKDNVELNNDG